MQMRDSIRILRIQHGLTQREVGNMLNTTQQAVSHWERGLVEPDTITIRSLAKLFHVPVDAIVGEENHFPADNAVTQVDGAVERFRRAIETLNDNQIAFLLNLVEDVAQGGAIQSLK